MATNKLTRQANTVFEQINTLKEYIIKGFVMDDYRLKNGQYFGKDYFDRIIKKLETKR